MGTYEAKDTNPNGSSEILSWLEAHYNTHCNASKSFKRINICKMIL
jgi:hypothetical protein